MEIRSIGIDLGKTTFHMVALGRAGEVLVRRKFTQKQLLTFGISERHLREVSSVLPESRPCRYRPAACLLFLSPTMGCKTAIPCATPEICFAVEVKDGQVIELYPYYWRDDYVTITQ